MNLSHFSAEAHFKLLELLLRYIKDRTTGDSACSYYEQVVPVSLCLRNDNYLLMYLHPF